MKTTGRRLSPRPKQPKLTTNPIEARKAPRVKRIAEKDAAAMMRNLHDQTAQEPPKPTGWLDIAPGVSEAIYTRIHAPEPGPPKEPEYKPDLSWAWWQG